MKSDISGHRTAVRDMVATGIALRGQIHDTEGVEGPYAVQNTWWYVATLSKK